MQTYKYKSSKISTIAQEENLFQMGKKFNHNPSLSKMQQISKYETMKKNFFK